MTTIRILKTEKGKEMAFKWNQRWFPMALDEAKLKINLDQVETVIYGPNPFQYAVALVERETTPNGNHIYDAVRQLVCDSCGAWIVPADICPECGGETDLHG